VEPHGGCVDDRGQHLGGYELTHRGNGDFLRLLPGPRTPDGDCAIPPVES
jgi:hypothetical protein